MRIIHGVYYARPNYVIWAMKELGLEFENIPVNPMDGSAKKPEYLALNPAGLIPTYQEDDFILRETMAINYYLAKNHGDGLLWVSDPMDEALVMQWCFFGILYIDKPSVDYILYKIFLPEEMLDPEKVKASEEALLPQLKILNDHLAGRDYLAADKFTIADLNLSAMLEYARNAKFDFSAFGNVMAWMDRCLSRPMRLEMNKRD